MQTLQCENRYIAGKIQNLCKDNVQLLLIGLNDLSPFCDKIVRAKYAEVYFRKRQGKPLLQLPCK